MASQYSTCDGPSKFDLMVSLFEGNPKNRKVVTFKVDQSADRHRQVDVAITSIAQRDESGEYWTFEGYSTLVDFVGKVRGYYSSQSRQGTIEVLE